MKRPRLHVSDGRMMPDGSTIFVAPVDGTYASFVPMSLVAAIKEGPSSTFASSPPLHDNPAHNLDQPTCLQAAGIYATPADGTFYT